MYWGGGVTFIFTLQKVMKLSSCHEICDCMMIIICHATVIIHEPNSVICQIFHEDLTTKVISSHFFFLLDEKMHDEIEILLDH